MLTMKENTEELERIANQAKIKIRIIGCGGGIFKQVPEDVRGHGQEQGKTSSRRSHRGKKQKTFAYTLFYYIIFLPIFQEAAA